MQYVTVFDIVQDGLGHLLRNFGPFWFAPLLFIAFGIAAIRGKFEVFAGFTMRARYMYVCGFVMIQVFMIALSLYEYTTLKNALQEGRCDVVEGVVVDFRPYQAGHKREEFKVNGVEFSYSDYGATAGFNRTALKGGPIREGLKVRIHHYYGKIARLEVEVKQPR